MWMADECEFLDAIVTSQRVERLMNVARDEGRPYPCRQRALKDLIAHLDASNQYLSEAIEQGVPAKLTQLVRKVLYKRVIHS